MANASRARGRAGTAAGADAHAGMNTSAGESASTAAGTSASGSGRASAAAGIGIRAGAGAAANASAGAGAGRNSSAVPSHSTWGAGTCGAAVAGSTWSIRGAPEMACRWRWLNHSRLGGLLCGYVPVTSTSVQAVVLCPFWGYAAASSLILFGLIWGLGAHARKSSAEWTRLDLKLPFSPPCGGSAARAADGLAATARAPAPDDPGRSRASSDSGRAPGRPEGAAPERRAAEAEETQRLQEQLQQALEKVEKLEGELKAKSGGARPPTPRERAETAGPLLEEPQQDFVESGGEEVGRQFSAQRAQSCCRNAGNMCRKCLGCVASGIGCVCAFCGSCLATCIWLFCRCLLACTREIMKCSCELFKQISTSVYRLLLQTILQWWVPSLLVLIWMFVSESGLMQRTYGYGIFDLKSLTEVPNQMRSVEEQMGSVPHLMVGCSLKAVGFIYVLAMLQIFFQVMFHFGDRCVSCEVFAVGAALITRPRDVAIQVLLLPMVYGLLSAINVRYMLNNMSASSTQGNLPGLLFCHDQDEAASVASLVTNTTLTFAKATQREAFESNFALADMYEAWALYQYVELIVTVLVEEMNLHHGEGRQVGESFGFLLKVNLQGFVFVCIAGAVYTVMNTWCMWRGNFDPTKHWNFLETIAGLQKGALWCVSMIAIYCILKIEIIFEKQLHKHNFQPKIKFWTIKIMIAFSFWLQIVMAIIRDFVSMTEDQSNLIDASLRIYVMAAVAFLNFWAWSPYSKWYNTVKVGDARQKVDYEAGKVALLQVPQITVSFVRELFPDLSEEDARDLNKVKARIEEKIGGDAPSSDPPGPDERERELLLMLHKGREVLRRQFDEYEPVEDRTPGAGSSKTLWRTPKKPDPKAQRAPRKSFWDAGLEHEERRSQFLARVQSMYPPQERPPGDKTPGHVPGTSPAVKAAGSRAALPTGAR